MLRRSSRPRWAQPRGVLTKRNWASAGWELHKPQWTEENCCTRHRGPVIHRPPSFRPRHRRRHICHIKLCMGKWFLEKLGVPHFWPKDGRHQTGDTGVADSKSQTQHSRLESAQTKSRGGSSFQSARGAEPSAFSVLPQKQCDSNSWQIAESKAEVWIHWLVGTSGVAVSNQTS